MKTNWKSTKFGRYYSNSLFGQLRFMIVFNGESWWNTFIEDSRGNEIKAIDGSPSLRDAKLSVEIYIKNEIAKFYEE